ncbi:unnamed protein product [Schistosoma curassoni]|uniref:DUF3700 domain-containing protein n=1 Tax=Schistosoma curassoni TaxID=6186 RepID=A0A183KQR0_9TREM|nr:unnamed protein product [Schistosoma curassoni]
MGLVLNATLALQILVFTSASEPLCPSMMHPRYVKDSTSSRVSPSRMIGLLFSALNLGTLVFLLCTLRPTNAETAATLAVFICICSCVRDRRARSSAKSKWCLPNSGKNTFCKQMRLHFGDGFPVSYRNEMKPTILANTTDAIAMVLEYMKDANISFSDILAHVSESIFVYIYIYIPYCFSWGKKGRQSLLY